MNLCKDCKEVPKALPKHSCHWCLSKKEGTDHQVASIKEQWPAGDNPGHCTYCDRDVPKFHMVSGKRCKPCLLASQRDSKDLKHYGLESGVRQQWYDAQDGKCFGCGNKQRVTGLAMHHSHLTGEPYFLACMSCNQGVMGIAFDNPQILLRLGLGMLYPPHTPGNLDKINKILAEI